MLRLSAGLKVRFVRRQSLASAVISELSESVPAAQRRPRAWRSPTAVLASPLPPKFLAGAL